MDRETALYGFISEVRGGRTVSAETRLKRDLKMDDFDLFDLVLKIEARFDCALPDELWRRAAVAGHLWAALECALDKKVSDSYERSL